MSINPDWDGVMKHRARDPTPAKVLPPAMPRASRCNQPVTASVRDRQRTHQRFVCDRHVVWAQQEIVRLGYQALVIPVQAGTPAQREIVSGCCAPRGWRVP